MSLSVEIIEGSGDHILELDTALSQDGFLKLDTVYFHVGDKHADHDTLESGKQLVGNALDTLTAACTREMMKGNNENILNLDLDLRKCKGSDALLPRFIS